MDAFGIGAALKGATDIYFHAARGTGRTTFLLETVKDGDRVIFLTQQTARHFQRLSEEMGKMIDVMVVPTDDIRRVFQRGTPNGRTIFDHMWVEAYYQQQLRWATEQLDTIQRESSGKGMAHTETRLAAQELNRWQR